MNLGNTAIDSRGKARASLAKAHHATFASWATVSITVPPQYSTTAKGRPSMGRAPGRLASCLHSDLVIDRVLHGRSDRARLVQIGDLVVVKAQFGQDRIGVLP